MATNLRGTPLYTAVANERTAKLRNTPMYVAVQDEVQFVTRSLSGFVLERNVEEVMVRNVTALVMQPFIKSGFFNATGLDKLLAAIKAELGVTVTPTLATLSDPVAVAGVYDTTVDVVAARTSDYSGKVVVRYSRFALGDDALAGQDLSSTVGTANTVHGRLAAVNTKYGLKLEPRDIVDYPIPAGQGYFPLEVAPTSYLFNVGTGVYIGDPANDLGSLISVSNLAGFDPES